MMREAASGGRLLTQIKMDALSFLFSFRVYQPYLRHQSHFLHSFVMFFVT
jgi:hypothetical protein